MNKRNNHGLTMIGLILIILIILVFVVIAAVILVPVIEKKIMEKEIFEKIGNELLQDSEEIKIPVIEANAKEEMSLACSEMRLAILQVCASNSNYSARENASQIQKSLLNLLQKDTHLSKQGWVIDDYATNGDSTFTLVYQGEDYKKATNNSNAKIVFTLQVGISSIEVK